MKLSKIDIAQLLVTAILIYWIWSVFPVYIIIPLTGYVILNYALYLFRFFIMEMIDKRNAYFQEYIDRKTDDLHK